MTHFICKRQIQTQSLRCLEMWLNKKQSCGYSIGIVQMDKEDRICLFIGDSDMPKKM